ncbi:MAG: hypothetical protein ACLFQP_06675 [Halothece sp.]
MDFRGSIYYPPARVLGQLLFPFAQVKKLFVKIYDFILKSIWSELISGEKIDSEVVNLVLFFIFCGLSWLFFQFQSYREIILVFLFILLMLDKQISQFDYKKIKNWLPIVINIDNDNLIIKSIRFGSDIVDLEYNKTEITSSAIAPHLIFSHGFQSEIAVTWQTILILSNGADIIINETKRPETALRKLKPLASQLEIPIKYIDSEGYHPYAMFDLNWEKNRKVNAVKIEKSKNNTWHIYSQWRWQDSWQLLKEILQRSGFFIFVLIMSRFMVNFGGFINYLFGNQTLFFDFSYFGQSLIPKLGITIYLELLMTIGIIIFEGLIISQSKHIYLDQSSLKYVISHKKQAQLSRETIEAALFLPQPTPRVLILGEKQTITIKNLQNSDAYRSVVEAIERATK